KTGSSADKKPINLLSVLDSNRLHGRALCLSLLSVPPRRSSDLSRGISRTSLQPVKTRLIVSPCLIRSACQAVPHVDHACEWYFLGALPPPVSRTSLQPIKTRLIEYPCLIRSACQAVPYVEHASE